MAELRAIFDFDNYRDYLEKLVSARDVRGQTRAQLATAMGCQPAYFSQVLKGRVHLTEDHGVRLCEFLRFSEDETDHFLLLLRKDRAGTPELARYLEEKRQRTIANRKQVEGRIGSEKKTSLDAFSIYYSADWMPSAVHMATSCAHLQTIDAIATRLFLAKELVASHLDQLQKNGLVKFEDGRWKYAGASIHFPKSSPLDGHFQMSRRLQALQSLSRKDDRNLHYSVTFSADAATLQQLKELYIEAISRMHKVVEPSPSDDVFALTLDLFRV